MKKRSLTGGLLVNSVIYSFSGLLLKCFSFFLLPLYTSYLSTEDYGVINIASSFLMTGGFIVSFSLFSAVMRFYVDLKEDERNLKRFYGTIVVFIFASSTVAGILLCCLGNFLSRYVFSGIDFFPVIFVCVASLAFHCQHYVYDNILKSQQQAAKVSIISILSFLIGVGLNILFVVVLKFGALGVVLSTACVNVLHTLYFMFDMIRTKAITFCLDRRLLKEALKYSVPIVPHNLSTQITVLISQVLIGGAATLSSVGVYSIAAQFGNIADTIQSYVNQAYGPWLYERLHAKENDYKKTIRGIVNMLVMIVGLFMLGIALFAEDYIILFIDRGYIDACKYVPLVILVYTIKIAYYFYVNILFYYKKASKLLFVSTLTSSIINILLSAILIPTFGVYGSIYADAISMFIRVLIVVIISKQFEDVGLRVRDFILNCFIIIGFVAAGLILSVFKYHGVFSIFNFAYKVLIVLLYVALVVFLYRKQLLAFLRTLQRGNREKRV